MIFGLPTWLAGRAIFADSVLSFDDIVFDLKNDCPKHFIFKYANDANVFKDGKILINYAGYYNLYKISSEGIVGEASDVVTKNFEKLLLNLKDNEI